MSRHDVLACMSFPTEHRAKLHSNNPIEGVNSEIKCRTEVVGIFPKEDAFTASSVQSCSNKTMSGGAARQTLEPVPHWAMIPSSACQQ